MYFNHQQSINREILSAIGTISASIIALGLGMYGNWFMREENEKRRKFEQKNYYYDENILNTTIPVCIEDISNFIEVAKFGRSFSESDIGDIYIKLSSKNGEAWKYKYFIISNDNSQPYIDSNSNNDILNHPSKISCIQSALKQYDAKIIY